MAYMECGDLRVYIHQHGVSLSSAKSIAIQTLEGLEVMYSKHIYHRDIKPQVGVRTILEYYFRNIYSLKPEEYSSCMP